MFKFIIEHVLSNFNWMVYLTSATLLVVSIGMDFKKWQAWLSTALYTFLGYLFWDADRKHGTEAIRYLDNGYWGDPYLYPSLFYMVGWLKHVP